MAERSSDLRADFVVKPLDQLDHRHHFMARKFRQDCPEQVFQTDLGDGAVIFATTVTVLFM